MAPLPKRILFVDDEPAIRVTLSAILRRYGFLVTVAATVGEALEAIRTREFDLLLSDLNIECAGDGYEVIRAIRSVNPGCVTIVLTGHPDVESAVEGIHLGIDDYILKPAKADVLVALLAEKLAARQPKARILTVWDDEPPLRSLTKLLESHGYRVVAARGNLNVVARGTNSFDLLLIAASIPALERKAVIESFREISKAPVVAVGAASDEGGNDDADFEIEAEPELVLKAVDQITRKGAIAAPKIGAAKQIKTTGNSAVSN